MTGKTFFADGSLTKATGLTGLRQRVAVSLTDAGGSVSGQRVVVLTGAAVRAPSVNTDLLASPIVTAQPAFVDVCGTVARHSQSCTCVRTPIALLCLCVISGRVNAQGFFMHKRKNVNYYIYYVIFIILDVCDI